MKTGAEQASPVAAAGSTPATGRAQAPRARLWRRVKSVAPWLLSALVLGLLARQLHTVDWPQVAQALRQQPKLGLVWAVGLALLSYALFAAYDLVGRRVTGHPVSVPRTLRIAAICYAFNLNFGALVGAMALKLRLYSREGLDAATTGRVIGLSVLGNWMGYLLLGGLLLLLAPPPMPDDIALPSSGLRAVGGLMLLLSAAYLLLCWRGPRRSAATAAGASAGHHAGGAVDDVGDGGQSTSSAAGGPAAGRVLAWRGHHFTLPNGQAALVQLVLSAANWALMGVVLWLLLQQRVAYPTVLGVLMLAAAAGVATHVPAGLGVLEAVFLACLGGEVPQGTLLAALLAYRATYYLAPLLLASAAYGLGEMVAPASHPSGRSDQPDQPDQQSGRRASAAEARAQGQQAAPLRPAAR